MVGQDDVFLNFVEFFGFDGGQWVFLCFDCVVLQCQIDFGKGDGGGVCFIGMWYCQIGGYVWYVYFQFLYVGIGFDVFVGCGVVCVVIGYGGDVVV